MSEVVYRSFVKVSREFGPVRNARLPAEKEAVTFGVHGEIAEHYGVEVKPPLEPHATTIDYVVAAAAG